MSPSSRRSANQRRGGVQRSLSEDQIVDVALELTVDAGLNGLTMAALAKRLGVGVMTLYSYFRGRNELLGAMAQKALVWLYDQHTDLEGGTWDEELRAHYRATRDSLKCHPAFADLLFYRAEELPGSPAARQQLAEHVGRHVEAMIKGGIEPSLAVRAFYGLSWFTLAASLREDDVRLGSPSPTPWPVTSLWWGTEAMTEYASPYLQGSMPDVRFGSDDEFDVMLDLVLRGLKATIKD